MTNVVQLRRKNVVYVASDYEGDLVLCEICEKKIKPGQRVIRWKEGIRTHEDCS